MLLGERRLMLLERRRRLCGSAHERSRGRNRRAGRCAKIGEVLLLMMRVRQELLLVLLLQQNDGAHDALLLLLLASGNGGKSGVRRGEACRGGNSYPEARRREMGGNEGREGSSVRKATKVACWKRHAAQATDGGTET